MYSSQLHWSSVRKLAFITLVVSPGTFFPILRLLFSSNTSYTDAH